MRARDSVRSAWSPAQPFPLSSKYAIEVEQYLDHAGDTFESRGGAKHQTQVPARKGRIDRPRHRRDARQSVSAPWLSVPSRSLPTASFCRPGTSSEKSQQREQNRIADQRIKSWRRILRTDESCCLQARLP